MIVTKRLRVVRYCGASLRASARLSLVVLLTLLMERTAAAQQIVAAGNQSDDGLWQAATDQALPMGLRRADLVGPYAVVRLARAALDAQLVRAPNESDPTRADRPVIITLPLPDGRFSRFRVEESPILAPELAAAFPSIKTYRGAGIDDRTASARLDLTPAGFHAMVIAAGGTVYVEPYAAGELVNHVTYDKSSLRRPDTPSREFLEGQADAPRPYNELPIVNGTVLRTYRLALAATQEYVAAAGGTQELALARMTTSMNRVNGIYERELAVRMTLSTGSADHPLALISTSNVDYTNGNERTMLNQNQARVDAIVGTGNYDIGHVFSTGGGGVAHLDSVCSATSKARGVTGSLNPVADAFDVDYVAHEMGHQFGGNHSFNGTSGSCYGNRAAAHAYEVGSGSTIMGYAGICRSEDTQLNSHDFFNFESLNEITTFITSGGGASCGMATATGNTLPSVTVAASTFTIPAWTPFTLSATATDADKDALTYIWEEHDLGDTSFSVITASADFGNRPLFRSYVPTSESSRTFPSLAYILSYANVPPQTYGCPRLSPCLTGETLPTTGRTMYFEVTVRDNRAMGGAIVTAATEVIVIGGVGPFTVTSPDAAITWPGLSTQTVSWNVNGTSALAANVKISLSTDGGATFPLTLIASTPNDGSENIFLPNTPTATARIKVEAVDNIFFDLSNTDFTIVAGNRGELAGDVALDFGPDYGLWLRYNPAGAAPLWMPIHPFSPSVMTGGDIDGNGRTDLVVTFPGYGVWAWMNNTNWLALHGFDADQIAMADLDGNGQDEVIVSFPGNGIWAHVNHTSWIQLHGANPSRLLTANVDGDAGGQADLVVSFPGLGIWIYMNNAAWLQLHGLDATVMQAGDIDGNGQDEVVLNLPGQGVWLRVNGSSWTQLHGADADGMTVGNIDGDAAGRQDLVINFPGAGVWAFMNGGSWVRLHPLNASSLATKDLDLDGRDDVILSFPGYGAWVWMNDTSYVPMHPLDAEAVTAGQFDDR